MTVSRRSLLAGIAAIPAARVRRASADPPRFVYPMGRDGRPGGDGFVIRHGHACENVAFLPGWWHCGENWYRADGTETANDAVRSVAAGDVVFVGSDYPGLVVIVRHRDDLFSMYGHLDRAPLVEPGEPVAAGQAVGATLARTDGRSPSHLHFEMRTFLLATEVNGAAPRYDVPCGVECPPGPGYWPMGAPDHPADLGWRNPVHALHHLAFPGGAVPEGMVAVVNGTEPVMAELHADPDGPPQGRAELAPDTPMPLLAVSAGDAASRATGAEGYRLWYRVRLPGRQAWWLRAAVPDSASLQQDGRPAAIRLPLLPFAA